MNFSKQEIEHAVRYANEHAKLFLMQRMKTTYPEYFSDAVLETREADSNKDYYVPRALKGRCWVVTRTAFTQHSCERLACFPFREDGSVCKETDPVRWIRMGLGKSLACQQSCFNSASTVDAEWDPVRSQCLRINPYQKFLAVFPEEVFGATSQHPLHGGLTWDRQRLSLNKRYCQSYGLTYREQDCVVPAHQWLGEILLGKTAYRAIRRSTLQPAAFHPPPVPPHVSFPKRSKRSSAAPGRNKRSVPSAPLDPNSSTTATLFKEIAIEVSVDLGVDVSAHMVKHWLTRHAPSLITKAVSGVAMKSSLSQLVVHQMTTTATKAFVMMGKVVGGASASFTVYGIVSVVVDVMDPFHYDKVLSKAHLNVICQNLDVKYYGRPTWKTPELTPEFVWTHVLVEEDQSELYDYMSKCILEYLQALHSTESIQKSPSSELKSVAEEKRWNWIVHLVVVTSVAVFALLSLSWIHVWSGLVFAMAVCFA